MLLLSKRNENNFLEYKWITSYSETRFFTPLFKKYDPDVLCLQETKVEPIQLPEKVQNVPGYYSYFSHPKNKKRIQRCGNLHKRKTKRSFLWNGHKKVR